MTKYTPSGIEFNIGNAHVTFVNQTHDTTSGFAHDTSLFINNCRVSDATCYYLNRTWECYRYQSVMKKAAYNAREWYIADFKRIYMNNRGWKKMTAARKEEFDAYVIQKEPIILLDEIMKRIENGEFDRRWM